MKKRFLPLTPNHSNMKKETYTDFGVSYLIQTFVNKINTPEFQIFRKNIFILYEMSENVLLDCKQWCLTS